MGLYDDLKAEYPTSNIIQLMEMPDDVPYPGQDGVGLKQCLEAVRKLYGTVGLHHVEPWDRERAIREILYLRHRYLEMTPEEKTKIEVED